LEKGQALAELMDKFFTVLAGKKPGTHLAYRSVRNNLEDYFGKSKPVAEISTSDADAWRAWMVEHDKVVDEKKIRVKLSPGTVGRRVIAARTIFNKAMRWGMVKTNVFVGVEAGQQVNEARKRFISGDIIEKVIAEAPDAEWKAIIALARYAGLRVPSELFTLR
jgi:integrase